MIEFLLSLPELVGGVISMVLTTVAGLAVYAISFKLVSKYRVEDIAEPASSLFNVVGILVGLMLSLAFGDVIREWRDIQNALKGEVVAIADTFNDLRRFDPDKTQEARLILVDYAQAVLDDDWPALANGSLGQHAEALTEKLYEEVIDLEPANQVQENLKARILDDVDLVSGARTIRLYAALSQPPVFIYVVFLGFLITMLCFGVYSRQPPMVAIVSLYSGFVGLVLYLILALSDPFQGGISIDPTAIETLVEMLGSLE